jgi:hypothetical protein
MKNALVVLAATTVIGLSGSIYAAEDASHVKSNIDYKKNGGYEASTTSERTDANGAKSVTQKEVDVDVDAHGNIDKTVKNETITSKGLMNKKSDTDQTQYQEKERGGYTQTTTRKHKNSDGTDVTYKTVTDVDVDEDGDVTTKATTEKTVDPKGLFNEKTTKSVTKSVNGKIIQEDIKK